MKYYKNIICLALVVVLCIDIPCHGKDASSLFSLGAGDCLSQKTQLDEISPLFEIFQLLHEIKQISSSQPIKLNSLKASLRQNLEGNSCINQITRVYVENGIQYVQLFINGQYALYRLVSKSNITSSNSQVLHEWHFGKKYKLQLMKKRVFPSKTRTSPQSNLLPAILVGGLFLLAILTGYLLWQVSSIEPLEGDDEQIEQPQLDPRKKAHRLDELRRFIKRNLRGDSNDSDSSSNEGVDNRPLAASPESEQSEQQSGDPVATKTESGDEVVQDGEFSSEQQSQQSRSTGATNESSSGSSKGSAVQTYQLPIPKINFYGIDGINFDHKDGRTLLFDDRDPNDPKKIRKNRGFAFGELPESDRLDLLDKPFVRIRYRSSTGANILLELKNKVGQKEEQIAGYKIPIYFPSTGEEWKIKIIKVSSQTVSINLRVIAFSDSRGHLEIGDISFHATFEEAKKAGLLFLLLPWGRRGRPNLNPIFLSISA